MNTRLAPTARLGALVGIVLFSACQTSETTPDAGAGGHGGGAAAGTGGFSSGGHSGTTGAGGATGEAGKGERPARARPPATLQGERAGLAVAAARVGVQPEPRAARPERRAPRGNRWRERWEHGRRRGGTRRHWCRCGKRRRGPRRQRREARPREPAAPGCRPPPTTPPLVRMRRPPTGTSGRAGCIPSTARKPWAKGAFCTRPSSSARGSACRPLSFRCCS